MGARHLWGAGAAVLAMAFSTVAVAGTPRRIMSMNQCTDLLLLQMVPKARIASVTYLAADGAGSLFPGRAAGVPVNYGTAEDILKFKPDLILADRFSTPVTRRLAKAVGAPILEVDGAATFADIRATVHRLGVATGETARARALIDQMDADLARLAAHARPEPRRVVAWSGSAVPGKGTLTNAIIEAAGAVNIAAAPGPTYATFDAEQLLAAAPDALLFGGARSDLRSQEGQHRLTWRLYGKRRIVYDEIAYTCGLPQSARAALDLRRALDALPRGPETRR